MGKIKVHELAKELNITVKELFMTLKKKDIDVKSHMSSINDNDVLKIREQFSDYALIEKSNLLSSQTEPEMEILLTWLNTKNNLLNEINLLQNLKKHLKDEIENLYAELNNLKVYKDNIQNEIITNKPQSLDLPDFMKGM